VASRIVPNSDVVLALPPPATSQEGRIVPVSGKVFPIVILYVSDMIHRPILTMVNWPCRVGRAHVDPITDATRIK
jgi:hypothetical protein